ncbi:MAG: hypothetical protein IJZ16_04640 [Clostridia bacterium]|nr:hypothetical protein [Clostridia bacterium]
MKVIHTTLPIEDAEVLTDFCDENHITTSALVKTLVSHFLDTQDKSYVAYITNEAKKVKPGRPKQNEGVLK